MRFPPVSEPVQNLGKCRICLDFAVRQRGFFAGILWVFQEKLPKYGGERLGKTTFPKMLNWFLYFCLRGNTCKKKKPPPLWKDERSRYHLCSRLKQADTLRPLTGPAVSAYTGSLQRNNSKATFHTCFYKGPFSRWAPLSGKTMARTPLFHCFLQFPQCFYTTKFYSVSLNLSIVFCKKIYPAGKREEISIS